MIYFDHNATTPLRPEVAELIARTAAAAVEVPVNPSSVHRAGRAARERLDAARAAVARVVGCEPREVCFTGSGSEANALAFKGAFHARRRTGARRVVLSAIEHPALLSAAAQLEGEGAEVIRVRPQASGRVAADEVIAALDGAALCSLMWCNNETGVLQPVAEVARACRARGVLFHCDAVQAAGKVPVSLREVPADLLSLSAHKFGGPPGVGALIARADVPLRPIAPGHQESGRRAGTHAVAAIQSLALALELAAAEVERVAGPLGALRDRFEQRVRALVGGVVVQGEDAPRAPNTSSLRFDGTDGEALLIALDLEGICASSGAACSSGSLSPSHVLTAMGLTPEQAQSTLRFSLGPRSTAAEVDAVVDALARHVPKARAA